MTRYCLKPLILGVSCSSCGLCKLQIQLIYSVFLLQQWGAKCQGKGKAEKSWWAKHWKWKKKTWRFLTEEKKNQFSWLKIKSPYPQTGITWGWFSSALPFPPQGIFPIRGSNLHLLHQLELYDEIGCKGKVLGQLSGWLLSSLKSMFSLIN